MALAFGLGVAYLLWLAVSEGWRFWVVLGLLLLVAGVALLAHGLMRWSRRG